MASTHLPDAVTRRMVQSPRMKQRMNSFILTAAHQVHRRRLLEWLESDSLPYPTIEESLEAAEVEIGDLCRALGPLVGIDPLQFDSDRMVLHDASLVRLDLDGEDSSDWEDC